MKKNHNKEGPDCDVGCHIFRLSRDGTKRMANDRNERMPRDGTERMPRDGTDVTERLPRDGIGWMSREGTERMPRDGTDVTERLPRDGIGWMRRVGTERMARDGIRGITIDVSIQIAESTWIPLKYPIIKPPGKGFFNRGSNFRRRNEIGGKPRFGCGEAELCPDVIGGKNDKFSKFAALEFENLILNTTY